MATLQVEDPLRSSAILNQSSGVCLSCSTLFNDRNVLNPLLPPSQVIWRRGEQNSRVVCGGEGSIKNVYNRGLK